MLRTRPSRHTSPVRSENLHSRRASWRVTGICSSRNIIVDPALPPRYRDGGKPRIAAGRPVKVNSGKIQMRQVLGLALASLLFAGAAQARPMQVLQTTPADNATIDSLNMQFVVRFDGDVDHRASRLYVTSGENVVEELHPSLSAAPRVLFANSPRLPAGSYELHWDGKFLPDGDITSGSLHFRVK